MNSMTGYGEGRVQSKYFSIDVELQSYNHRFLDIRVKLPPGYSSMEQQLVKQIASRVERGRVNALISLQEDPGRTSVRIDEELARKYWRVLKRLQNKLNVPAAFNPEVLIELPGVLQVDSRKPSAREFKKCLTSTLGMALDRLVKMREKEGAALRSELKSHLRSLNQGLNRAKKRTAMLNRRSGKNKFSTGESGLGVNVREEISRLESHLQQFKQIMDTSRPVGKALEFISQEMLREVTTLADKAGDSVISRQAVRMKTEIENIREQIRNVE